MPSRPPRLGAKPPRKPWSIPGKNARRRQRGRRGVEDRRRILNEEPLCYDPFGRHAATGEIAPSQEVDHKDPDLPDPLWEARENKGGICAACHKEKTAAEALRGRRT